MGVPSWGYPSVDRLVMMGSGMERFCGEEKEVEVG